MSRCLLCKKHHKVPETVHIKFLKSTLPVIFQKNQKSKTLLTTSRSCVPFCTSCLARTRRNMIGQSKDTHGWLSSLTPIQVLHTYKQNNGMLSTGISQTKRNQHLNKRICNNVQVTKKTILGTNYRAFHRIRISTVSTVDLLHITFKQIDSYSIVHCKPNLQWQILLTCTS